MSQKTKPELIAQWYDAIAPHYAIVWPLIIPSYTELNNNALRIVDALGLAPRRILDLGCGPAFLSTALAQRTPGARVTCVDLSERMRTIARNALRTNLEEAIACDLASSELGTRLTPPYDLIVLFFGLHHLTHQDILSVYPQLYQVLAPEGVLLVAEEVATDAPGGRDVVGLLRRAYMESNRAAGFIPPEFMNAQAAIPASEHPPFHYARVDDHVSWLARASFAVSVPVTSLGSALFVAYKG